MLLRVASNSSKEILGRDGSVMTCQNSVIKKTNIKKLVFSEETQTKKKNDVHLHFHFFFPQKKTFYIS